MEIKLENIKYQDKLVNVTYDFKEASITSIIGSNIFGDLLINKIKKDSGNIYINGNEEYDLYSYLEKVGYVPSNPDKYFICELVKDEIAFELKQMKYDDDKIEKKVIDSLKMVGISSNIMNKRIVDLSSGEKAKISLASVLIKNPEVLIIENITSYLDSNSKNILLNLLLNLKNKLNKTIILMSNDMDFIYSLGNDYILINNGRMVRAAKVEKLDYNDEIFNKYGLKIPKVLEFVKLVALRKNKKIVNIRNIDDIVKEVMK